MDIGAAKAADIIGARVRPAFREELLWLMPLTAIVAGLYGVSEIAAFSSGLSTALLVDDYVGKALRALPLVFCAALLWMVVRAALSGDPRPLRRIARTLAAQVRDPMLVIAKVLPLVLMPVLLASYGMLKMLMPRFAPFQYDALFARIDAALFFGHQPWELTHALFGGIAATRAIDVAYTAWVFLLSVAIVWFALAAPRMERARFFLSFTAIWILLGTVGAYLGSSAGPCFLHLMGNASAPEFAGLMQRLADISAATASGGRPGLGAVGWQEVLWNAHTSQNVSFSMGISAMPSLHNAISVLYVLAAFRLGRVAGWITLAFAAAIFVGSVHLAWHYAIDGIVAAIAVIPIWLVVNAWLRRSGYDAAVRATDVRLG